MNKDSLVAVMHSTVKEAKNKGSGLDAESIADVVGKPYATLMSELSQQPGHKLGADLVVPLTQATGLDWGVNHIARALGGVFIPLPNPVTTNADLVQALAASVQEFGGFAAVTATSIADGDVPADQLARIDREGDEAIEAIIQMKKLARITHEIQYGRKKI